MTDSELIREVFARINGEPEASRKALRARIVRALRGECPASAPEEAEVCNVGESRTIEERTLAGRELVARKREKHYADRLARLQALSRAIHADLEPEVHPYIPQLAETEGNTYTVSLCIPGYAPILARWSWIGQKWSRDLWPSGWRCAPFAVQPYPHADTVDLKWCETLDEALAVAEDCYPAHLKLPEVAGAAPAGRPWYRRLVDWLALRFAASRFGEIQE